MGKLSDMVDDDSRVKFYGLDDGATYMMGERLIEILDAFDKNNEDYSISDILEFYNAVMLLDHKILPKDLSEQDREKYLSFAPILHKTISKFINSIIGTNISKVIKNVDYNYHEDLIDLIVKYKVYERIDGAKILQVLKKNKLRAYSLLSNKQFVNALDGNIRETVLADTENAELLISRYAESKSRKDINLPPSFTGDDVRELVDKYIDSEEPNPNYLELISNSRVNKAQGFDAKIKLKAKRRHEAWVEEFFNTNTGGLTFGVEVGISEDQIEPVVAGMDDRVIKYSYSRKWLDSIDNPDSALSAFIEVFEFLDQEMIMSLPSYKYELGVTERFMRMNGKDAYPTGISFQLKETTAFYQTHMFEQQLKLKDLSIEKIISWFFGTFIKKAYAVENFLYTPASDSATFLEKCRHLFAEMDSIVKKYSLFVENGELDTDLLEITSDSVMFSEIPSLLSNKYAVPVDATDIFSIMHYLFSDQSGLTYISEELKGKDFANLIMTKDVPYDAFHEWQRTSIDWMIEREVLVIAEEIVKPSEDMKIFILRKLFMHGAVSFNRMPAQAQSLIKKMIERGWLEFKNTLLTTEEVAMYNYYLNQREFGNGLDLRNKYLHGTQPSNSDENEHYKTYVIALELMLCLILKINDDLRLDKHKKDN